MIIAELNKYGSVGSVGMLAAFGLAPVGSIASYRLVERPALRLSAGLVSDGSR